MIFPHPLTSTEDGILAVGGDLDPETLLTAYRHGIFPWYSEGQPILWWFPRPRYVIHLDHYKIPKSMRPYFNQKKYNATLDYDFEQVITRCQQIPRAGQPGTWITEEMREAYLELHHQGHAHSVEVWKNDQLVGGLYGVTIGRIFSGESMFSIARDASKFGALALFQFLRDHEFTLIDCQQHSYHMERIGGTNMDEHQYFDLLRSNLRYNTPPLTPQKLI